jgi:DNA-binding MarR family transcriptional regulator
VRTDTIANVVGALAQAITDRIDDAIAEAPGRPHVDAAALVHLSKYRDDSIDALRQPLRLSHPGCVRLVDRLEESRLLGRSEGADRRSRSLRLTPAGEAAAKTVLRTRHAALRRALQTLTPREQQQLGRLVGKVLGGLVHDEAEALAVCRVCDYASCPDAVCPVARALEA